MSCSQRIKAVSASSTMRGRSPAFHWMTFRPSDDTAPTAFSPASNSDAALDSSCGRLDTLTVAVHVEKPCLRALLLLRVERIVPPARPLPGTTFRAPPPATMRERQKLSLARLRALGPAEQHVGVGGRDFGCQVVELAIDRRQNRRIHFPAAGELVVDHHAQPR